VTGAGVTSCMQAGAYWMLSPDEVRASSRRSPRDARPYVPVWLSPVVCPPSPARPATTTKYCPCKR